MIQSNIFHTATHSTHTNANTRAHVHTHTHRIKSFIEQLLFTLMCEMLFFFINCVFSYSSLCFKKFCNHSLNCFYNLFVVETTTYSLQHIALHMLKRPGTWYVSCEYSSSLTQALFTAGAQKKVNYTFEKGKGNVPKGRRKGKGKKYLWRLIS